MGFQFCNFSHWKPWKSFLGTRGLLGMVYRYSMAPNLWSSDLRALDRRLSAVFWGRRPSGHQSSPVHCSHRGASAMAGRLGKNSRHHRYGLLLTLSPMTRTLSAIRSALWFGDQRRRDRRRFDSNTWLEGTGSCAGDSRRTDGGNGLLFSNRNAPWSTVVQLEAEDFRAIYSKRCRMELHHTAVSPWDWIATWRCWPVKGTLLSLYERYVHHLRITCRRVDSRVYISPCRVSE